MRGTTRGATAVAAAIGLAAATVAAAGSAGAAAPPQQRASISTSGEACTVTATFRWKNVDPATFSYASVNLYPVGGGQVGQATSGDLFGGSVTVTAPGVSGQAHYALATVYYDGGGYAPVSETRSATLRCR